MIKPGDNVAVLHLYGENAHGSGLVMKKMIPDPEPNKYRILVDMEQLVIYIEPERVLTETQYIKYMREEQERIETKWK